MTLYDQTKITELKHATTVQKTLSAKIGIRYDGPIIC